MNMPYEKSLPNSGADDRLPRPAAEPGTRFSLGFLRVNRILNRPLASLIVGAVQRTRVTPNQLTWAAFGIGLAGAWALSRGTPGFFAVGGILTQLSSLVDCADGMLARARGETTEFGAALDTILDRINEFFLMAGCVFGYFTYSGRDDFLVLGLVGLGLYYLMAVVFYLVEDYAGNPGKSRSAENRGLFLFLIFLFGITNRLDIGLFVLFAVPAGMILLMVYQFLRLPRK
jgi:phosphatidylglycerophosphate synthase